MFLLSQLISVHLQQPPLSELVLMQRKLRKGRQVDAFRNAIILPCLILLELHLSRLLELLLLLRLSCDLCPWGVGFPDAVYFLPASAIGAAHIIYLV